MRGSDLGQYFPHSDGINGCAWIISVARANKKQHFFLGKFSNIFVGGAVNPDDCLTTIEALTMDEKLDDGAYNTGTVLSVTSGSQAGRDDGRFYRHDRGSCALLGVGYNATLDGVRCALSFEAGF